MMKIEKNIPITHNGKYHKIVLEMEDGDSVLCTKKEAGAIRQAIYKYCPGYRARMRVDRNAERDSATNDYKYRVWKVKKTDSGEAA